MTTPCFLGYHVATEREVFMLTLDSLDTPYAMRPSIEGRQFTCFCAMDARDVPAGEIGKFCVRLLQLGCAYLCTWGPDCERVHDIMDEEIVGDNPPQSSWGYVMTTWHSKESIADALDFFFNCTIPDETYAPDGCDCAVIISVGSGNWVETIGECVKSKYDLRSSSA
jgi:hypothetical protein